MRGFRRSIVLRAILILIASAAKVAPLCGAFASELAANEAGFLAGRPCVVFAAKKTGEAKDERSSESGGAAFGDWRDDRPGLRHHLTLNDLPKPYATPSASNGPRVVERPRAAKLSVPSGFSVALFVDGLDQPRTLRIAPNGDVFVAETAAGTIRVLRPTPDGATAAKIATFASGLSAPFGIAFYPAGANPKWVYVAEENRVVRFPYAIGDLKARSGPEIVVGKLAPTTGGHTTRGIVFSKDGTRLFVSVGSQSNAAEGMDEKGMDEKSPQEIREWEARHGLGAAWGFEESRAVVLSFTPEGKDRRIFATGLRNCVGLTIHPETGDLYCATNERDGLGDNLVPDYVTRVRDGDFFGWPWRYLGDHADPRWKGARPDLAGKVARPDVLIEPHSAPLGLAFYTGNAFPVDYRGAAFVALHGSWNRARRTGYKVVRVLMRDGHPTGEYEDFFTGFVVDDRRVWGRPVDIAEASDGSLLVSEDANGAIWRIHSTEKR